jgi:hypothetical protein
MLYDRTGGLYGELFERHLASSLLLPLISIERVPLPHDRGQSPPLSHHVQIARPQPGPSSDTR